MWLMTYDFFPCHKGLRTRVAEKGSSQKRNRLLKTYLETGKVRFDSLTRMRNALVRASLDLSFRNQVQACNIFLDITKIKKFAKESTGHLHSMNPGENG